MTSPRRVPEQQIIDIYLSIGAHTLITSFNKTCVAGARRGFIRATEEAHDAVSGRPMAILPISA
jgi:hypothetical protein